ncbi:MAG: hypothetical protein L0K01_10615, partial [Brachybacterium sp.]|nr:hypothetical protein [Brachybacterium sp.]
MWSFLRGKKRSERPSEDAAPRHDALSALASERREDRVGSARTAADEHASGTAGSDDDAVPGSPRAGTSRAGADAERPGNGYEVVLDPHADEIGAGIAPGQDEDDLPVTPQEHRPLSREDRVADALDRWSQQITGGIHAPSFLTQIRAGGVVLDLTHSHPSGLA